MSKGSAAPATQTQKVEIPDEFKAWVFGPGFYGGSSGSKSGFISKDVHNLHGGGLLGKLGDPLNLVKRNSGGSAPQYMDAGFEGILPMALKLAQAGNLNPTTVMSDATKQSQTSVMDLVDNLNNQFLPSTQALFDRVGNRDLVNAQETQDVIAASTRPIMEQLNRYAVPATQDAAIAAGQLGSSRQGIAEGLARSDANQQMSDIASQIAFGALQEQLAGERMALQFSPTLMQMMGMPTTLLSELGQQQEAYDLESRSGEARNLQSLAAMLQSFIPGTNATQTQEKARTGNEKLGGALSGGLAGFQVGGPWGALIGALGGAMMG